VCEEGFFCVFCQRLFRPLGVGCVPERITLEKISFCSSCDRSLNFNNLQLCPETVIIPTSVLETERAAPVPKAEQAAPKACVVKWFDKLPLELVEAIGTMCWAKDLGQLRGTSQKMNSWLKPAFTRFFNTWSLMINFEEDHKKAKSFFDDPSMKQLQSQVKMLQFNLPPDYEGEWPREVKSIVDETESTICSALEASPILTTIVIGTMHNTTDFSTDRCKYIAFLLFLTRKLSLKRTNFQIVLENVPYDGLAKISKILAGASQQDARRYLRSTCSVPWNEVEDIVQSHPVSGHFLSVDTLRIPFYHVTLLENVKHILSDMDKLKHLIIDTYPETLTPSAAAYMLSGMKPGKIQSILIDGCTFDKTHFKNAFADYEVLGGIEKINVGTWTCKTVAVIPQHHDIGKYKLGHTGYINEYRRRGGRLFLVEDIRDSSPTTPNDVLNLNGSLKAEKICSIAWPKVGSNVRDDTGSKGSTISMGQAIRRTARKNTYIKEKFGFVMINGLYHDSVVNGWVSLEDFYRYCGNDNVTSSAVSGIVKDTMSQWLISS
jgi:hypothetical protein